MTSVWHPPETAPLDGTYVIVAVKLWHADGPPAVAGAYYRGGDEEREQDTGWWWAGEGPGDYYADRIQGVVVAWMPFPAPPLSGLYDGPYLPGRAPRKKRAAKTPEELRAIRAKAWATRRARLTPSR